MNNKILSISRRIRSTPFSRRVEAAGVKAYSVYNHMLLPVVFDSPEADYWHLCEHVQVWDVSGERQVEITGPDAAKLVQLMTPRDLSNLVPLQGKYAPICDENGFILNDPIIIKHAEDRFWLSIADSDVKFFAKGLALGLNLDVKVQEPDVFPLAVQGPKAEQLVSRVFGEQVQAIRFFHGAMLPFQGVPMYVARSGWSKQGGFEIYLPKANLAEPLWDELFAQGQDLNVKAGCPNASERLEAGLLSYGNDMDEFDTPFECGLDSYLNMAAKVESLSLPALRAKQGTHTRKLVGLAFDKPLDVREYSNHVGGINLELNGELIGEIRSHGWSYRYNKHLAFAMLDLSMANQLYTIQVAGLSGHIYDLPFSPERLTQSHG